MSLRKVVLFSVVFLSVLATALEAQSVLVMPPQGGGTATVSRFLVNPFQASGSVQAATDTFLALSTPSGSKYYFVGHSGTNAVVVTDSNLGVLHQISLSQQPVAAAMTPNGNRLVVLGSSVLQVIETFGDQVVLNPSVGLSLTDVAVSMDSSRAYVLGSGGQSLTAIDLNSGASLGTISVLSTASGVSVGPNGLVYVAAQNMIREIDGRTMQIRRSISLNGNPGRLSFTPDGNRAFAVNQTPTTGGSLISVDLVNGTGLPVGQIGVQLDRLVVVSNTRAIASSTSTQVLYDVNLSSPVTITTASFGISGVQGLAKSDEVQSARYLFVSASSSIYRVDLASNQTSQLPLSTSAGPVSFAAGALSSSVSTALQYNNSQTVNPGSQSLPLVVRALDFSGRPAYNVAVSFTPSGGASVVSAMTTTNAQGFAQAVVQAPATQGSFTVTATLGFGITVNFGLISGTGGGVTPGVTGGVSIYSGNGQIIRESSPTQPLKVIVRDTSGVPLVNQPVTWTVTSGFGGSLFTTFSYTDSLGIASNTFIGGSFFGTLNSYDQATITAATGTGSVTFNVVVVPLLFNNQLVPFPTVGLVTPSDGTTLTGRSGTTLAGAIQIRVTAAPLGFQASQPIPNVGLSVTTGLDPATGPTATCQGPFGGEPLTDFSGIATCNLLLGGRPGTAPLTISGGGISVPGTVNVTVTPGLPSQLRIVQGDGQSGGSGQTLPLALVVEALDSFGNKLPGANVQWTVVSGDVTLINTINRTDTAARASTQVRLGNTAGQAQIRVASVEKPEVTATFTVTAIPTATQIQKESGNGQSAVVNQPFASPLVVVVLNQQNQGVSGVQVSFAVTSGSATVSSATATTGSDGRASTNVQAGGTTGPVVVTATLGSLSTAFNLTVIPAAPIVSVGGIINGVSGQPGISPCGIASITGSGVAAGVQGVVVANNILGPLPASLGGVSVSFSGHSAPIYHVSNVSGQEMVTVQVPCELAAPASISVTIQSGGGSTTVSNVPIVAASPGLFETITASGNRLGVVTRPDGSYVSETNPARRGEIDRMYVTGLGQVNPATGTNRAGVGGQMVLVPIVVGVNSAGVRVVSAQYAPGMVGVYIVDFEVPADTATGSNQPLAIAVIAPDGSFIFGNGSAIAIQ